MSIACLHTHLDPMDSTVWSDIEDWPSSFTCPITLEVRHSLPPLPFLTCHMAADERECGETEWEGGSHGAADWSAGPFFQVMRDPTMLRQTGHTFEREVGQHQQQPYSVTLPRTLQTTAMLRLPHDLLFPSPPPLETLRVTGHRSIAPQVIEQHLARHKRCPLSNVELTDCTLVPNHALRLV